MPSKTEMKRTPSQGACESSPTGAHHWMLGAPSSTMAGECKYCHAERQFKPFEDNIGFNNSPKRTRNPSAATGK